MGRVSLLRCFNTSDAGRGPRAAYRSTALKYSPDTAHLVQSGLYYLARTPKCIQSVIAPPAPGVFSRYRSCGSLSCRTTPPAWLHTAELYPWCMRVQVLCDGILCWYGACEFRCCAKVLCCISVGEVAKLEDCGGRAVSCVTPELLYFIDSCTSRRMKGRRPVPARSQLDCGVPLPCQVRSQGSVRPPPACP